MAHPAPIARRLLAVAPLMTTLAVTAGCAAGPDPGADVDHSRSRPPGGGGVTQSAHVHGVAVNPGDGRVYLATHHGLFRYDVTGPTPGRAGDRPHGVRRRRTGPFLRLRSPG